MRALRNLERSPRFVRLGDEEGTRMVSRSFPGIGKERRKFFLIERENFEQPVRIYSSSRRNIDFDTVFLVAILSRSSGRFFKYHHRHHPRGLSTVDNRRSALFNIHVEDLCLPSCPVCTTSKHGSLNTQPYTLLEIIVCQYA